jgi:hypothetical protein
MDIDEGMMIVFAGGTALRGGSIYTAGRKDENYVYDLMDTHILHLDCNVKIVRFRP